MKWYSVILPICLLLTGSCHNTSSPPPPTNGTLQPGADDSRDKDLPKPASPALEYLDQSFPAPENGYAARGFYKRMEGTVGGLPIVMHLHRKAGYQGLDDQPKQTITGFYYYEKYQHPIELIQVVAEDQQNPDNGKIVLGEGTSFEAGQQWTGTLLPNGQFKGTWSDRKSGRRLEFDLVENYPPGSVKLRQYHAGQFYYLNASDPEGQKASCDLSMLYPEDYESDLGQGIIWTIAPAIVNDSVTELGLHPSEMLLAGIAEYKSTLETQISDWGIDNMDHFNALSSRVEVVWNDKERLGLRFFTYTYTGGAHGNYGSEYLNLNLIRGGEIIRLQDVFLPGFEPAVTRELKLAARKQYGTSPNEVMTEPFYEENLEPTENFLLTDKGILFNYVPYEIAAYAIGEIRVFVPFAKLGDVLQE